MEGVAGMLRGLKLSHDERKGVNVRCAQGEGEGLDVASGRQGHVREASSS